MESACSKCNYKGIDHPNPNFINCKFYNRNVLEREMVRCADQSLIGHDTNFQLESLEEVIDTLKNTEGPQPRPTEEPSLIHNDGGMGVMLIILAYVLGAVTMLLIYK